MKTLNYRFIGITPLLCHGPRTVDPLDPYAKMLSILTAKRKRTDEDHREISRIEWEAGLYLYDGIIQIPAENIEACLLKAARREKAGPKYLSGAMVLAERFPLKYDGPFIQVKPVNTIPIVELDKFYEHFKHQGVVGIGKSKIIRTRSIFHNWSLEVSVDIDERVFDERTMDNIVTNAGQYCGLCEKRPRLGRFDVEKIK